MAKALLSQNLHDSLQFIKTNYGDISKAITKLQACNLKMSESINIIEEVSKSLNQVVPTPISERVKKKLHSVVNKNGGFLVMREIRNRLIQEEQMSEHETFYSQAPLTSCDVERTFSQYKNCLSDNRKRFTVRKLSMYMVIHCNADAFDVAKDDGNL